jgi:hypothetical protein
VRWSHGSARGVLHALQMQPFFSQLLFFSLVLLPCFPPTAQYVRGNIAQPRNIYKNLRD